jgi:hypothetical protein
VKLHFLVTGVVTAELNAEAMKHRSVAEDTNNKCRGTNE